VKGEKMSKELVKDRVIKYFIEDLFVPQEMIDTNVELSEFEEGAEGIIDIVVNVVDEDDFYVPVLICQCLDEDIPLEGDILEKQIDFLEEVDNITTSGRLVLTNGDEMMYADWKGEEYDTESALPNYETMVKEFKESGKLALELEKEHGHDHENCDCCDHDHQ